MKLNFFAPVNNLGYGIHSYNTMRAMDQLGHHVTLIPPFGRVGFEDEMVTKWLERRAKFDPQAPGVMIFHEEYLGQFCGSPRIGFPVFECEKFTALQLAFLKSCDALLTPSGWSRRVLIENGISPLRVHVVHEGFDPEAFPFVDKTYAEQRDQPFNFLHVGKYEERKGTDQAIRCFAKALDDQRAMLTLHIDNPFTNERPTAIIKGLGFVPTSEQNICFRRKSLAICYSLPLDKHEHMKGLYHQADCGLFPTRAEGWGLPILECLASGVPCIVGNWTGQSEYLQRGIAGYTISERRASCTAVPPAYGGAERGHWYEVPDGVLIEYIRDAFSEARAFRRNELWRSYIEDLRREYTWQNAARQMQDAIRDICGDL